MINNIIFLDIDGVLNSDKYFSSIEDKEDTYTDPVAKLLLDIDMTKVKLLLKVVHISHALDGSEFIVEAGSECPVIIRVAQCKSFIAEVV